MIRNILVNRNENIKTAFFGSLQQTPVFQARQSGEAGGLALVAWENKP
ncbi:MAG: hypothetical protein LAP87_13285 [Acidobacteriia bacterium]|nr:hypothetical protein [Terriglobia bacterium]